MSRQPPANGPKNIWQNQKTKREHMSLEEIRRKVRRIQMRNRINLILGIAATIFFGWAVFQVDPAFMRVGFALLTLGAPADGDYHVKGGLPDFSRRRDSSDVDRVLSCEVAWLSKHPPGLGMARHHLVFKRSPGGDRWCPCRIHHPSPTTQSGRAILFDPRHVGR
jgi:hypothetical protein